MSLKNLNNRKHSLASRLTLWYAVIFTLSAVAVFFSLHVSLSYIIKNKTDDELRHEFSELAESYNIKGLEGLKQAMVIESQSDGMDRLYLRLLTRSGEVLAATNNESFGEIPINQSIIGSLGFGAGNYFDSNVLPLEKQRVRMLYGLLNADTVLQVVFSQKDEDQFLTVFWRTVAVALVFLTTVASVIGWIMSRKAMKGVEEIIHAAGEISASELSKRVTVKKSGDEIEQLAITFNAMLDRIEALVTSMKELTDNIAHDLRSPIARMRVRAESALFEMDEGDPSESLAAKIIEECDRLLGMINTMLEISEAEAGVGVLKFQKVDVVGLLIDCCELFEPIAEDKNIDLSVDLPPSLFVQCDRQKLQRVIANLLDNALKYTAQGGEVTVHAQQDEQHIFLSFKDSGIGIAQDQVPNLFKRFYRCDSSRSQAGVGLGLSLAKALCQAHGGDITVTSLPGVGSTFTVILPA